jgi:hypothetical protein
MSQIGNKTGQPLSRVELRIGNKKLGLRDSGVLGEQLLSELWISITNKVSNSVRVRVKEDARFLFIDRIQQNIEIEQ